MSLILCKTLTLTKKVFSQNFCGPLLGDNRPKNRKKTEKTYIYLYYLHHVFQHLQILKSTFVQPRLLLRDCPLPFYPIYSYLMTASRLKLPSYQFLADKIKESKELLEEKQQEQRKKAEAAAKGTTNGTTTGMAGTPK